LPLSFSLVESRYKNYLDYLDYYLDHLDYLDYLLESRYNNNINIKVIYMNSIFSWQVPNLFGT